MILSWEYECTLFACTRCHNVCGHAIVGNVVLVMKNVSKDEFRHGELVFSLFLTILVLFVLLLIASIH